jgi:hypothetical protein
MDGPQRSDGQVWSDCLAVGVNGARLPATVVALDGQDGARNHVSFATGVEVASLSVDQSQLNAWDTTVDQVVPAAIANLRRVVGTWNGRLHAAVSGMAPSGLSGGGQIRKLRRSCAPQC